MPFVKSGHRFRIGLARVRAHSQSVLEVVHGLHEIFVRQAGQAGIFGISSPVRVVAIGAGAHRRLFAVRHNVRHSRMVFGIPIGRIKTVADLRNGESQLAFREDAGASRRPGTGWPRRQRAARAGAHWGPAGL